MTALTDGAALRGDDTRLNDGTGRLDSWDRRAGYDNPAAHIDEWHGTEDGEDGVICDWRFDCPLLVDGARSAAENLAVLGLTVDTDHGEATGTSIARFACDACGYLTDDRYTVEVINGLSERCPQCNAKACSDDFYFRGPR